MVKKPNGRNGQVHASAADEPSHAQLPKVTHDLSFVYPAALGHRAAHQKRLFLERRSQGQNE